jgi:MFS family permease
MFINYIPMLITSLLIIEIAFSFDIEVGIAGQIFTAQSIASAVVALLLGALSVRYAYKSLLLTGIVFACVAALSCALSPNFGFLLILYSLTGVSLAMVGPMSQSLIGALFSVQERPKVIGYQMAGYAFTYILGPHIINVFDS